MALSLDQLKAAFKKPENEGNTRPNNYYPFFQMEMGESATVRFLPDANSNNPLGFLVEKLNHNLMINGERRSVPCLKMYGDDCPICAVSAAYYKDGDKENGKKYWRNKTHLAQVLVIEDPMKPSEDGEKHTDKVRYLSVGYQLYNVIKEAFESGELDDVPFSYENGCNFIIKKSQQGEHPNYSIGSRFARSNSALSDEQIEYVEGQMIDLSELLPAAPEREKVEAMLTAALTGDHYQEDDQSGSSTPASKNKTGLSLPNANEDTPRQSKVEDKPAKVEEKVEEKVQSETKVEESATEGEDAAAQLLAQIRNRTKNKLS